VPTGLDRVYFSGDAAHAHAVGHHSIDVHASLWVLHLTSGSGGPLLVGSFVYIHNPLTGMALSPVTLRPQARLALAREGIVYM
jgi:hypothetical protein